LAICPRIADKKVLQGWFEMTFDELWRSDLARRSGSDPATSASAPEDVDQAEVTRFLEWLEKTLV
jgi:hypothetical protein